MTSYKTKLEGDLAIMQAYEGKELIAEKTCNRKEFKKEFKKFNEGTINTNSENEVVKGIQKTKSDYKFLSKMQIVKNDVISGGVHCAKIKIGKKHFNVKLSKKNEKLLKAIENNIEKKKEIISDCKEEIKKISEIGEKAELKKIELSGNDYLNSLSVKKEKVKKMSKTYLEISKDEKENFRRFPIIGKGDYRRFINAFYNDIEKNNIVATNGKVLIRITKNEFEKKLYEGKKFISLNGKNFDLENINFAPYEKVLCPDNETTIKHVTNSSALLTYLKQLKKIGRDNQKENKLNPDKTISISDFTTNDLKVYFDDGIFKLFNYSIPKKITYDLNQVINVLITLDNIRDNQENLSFTNINIINPLKISNDNFDILIMPMTGI